MDRKRIIERKETNILELDLEMKEMNYEQNYQKN